VSDIACTREGCQIASTGKCLEGFDPTSTCPYQQNSTLAHTTADPTDTPFVDLPTGEALTEVEASELTRQAITRVVVLAGPSGSGKTTILTSLFEAFFDAPFGNFRFAGSATLVGFERRCHDSRVVSGRNKPHTIHTKVSDTVDFLHLRLVPASHGVFRKQNLLLSDISGERFRALRDSSEAITGMPMLRRADAFCIVVDGEKLANPAERHSVAYDARVLLRSLFEAGALSPKCTIQIVLSKWDVVQALANPNNTLAYIADMKKMLNRLVGSNVLVQFFEIAARPENPKVPFAFGLPTLLRSWMDEPPTRSRARIYLPSLNQQTREATRFVASAISRARLEELYDVHWV